ncbi:MAG: hypothetical protein IKP95_07305 [Ruminococcus sp.]|nr:hypothetical protein [Ruminococcus sp.]
MKIRKIFAGMTAAALALTMMSFAAFAEEPQGSGDVSTLHDGSEEPSNNGLTMVGSSPKWTDKEITLTVSSDTFDDDCMKATADIALDEYTDWNGFEADFGTQYEAVFIWNEGGIDAIQQLDAQIYVMENPGWTWKSNYGSFVIEDEGTNPILRLAGDTSALTAMKSEENELGKAGVQFVAHVPAEAGLSAGDEITIKADYALFSDAAAEDEEESNDGLHMIGDKAKFDEQEIEFTVGSADSDGNLTAKAEYDFEEYTSWADFEKEFGTRYKLALIWDGGGEDDVAGLDAQVFVMENPGWTWKSNYGVFNIDGGKAETTITQPMLDLTGDTSDLTVMKSADNELGKAGIEFIAHIDPDSQLKEGDTFKLKLTYALFSDGEALTEEQQEQEQEQPQEEQKPADDTTPPATGAAAGALAVVAVLGAAAVVVSKKNK